MRELPTKRLVLREMPANLIADCLHDPEHALLSLGLRPAAQWPTADTRDILSILAQMVDPTTFNTMKCGFTLRTERTEADGMLFWDKQRKDIGGNINQG